MTCYFSHFKMVENSTWYYGSAARLQHVDLKVNLVIAESPKLKYILISQITQHSSISHEVDLPPSPHWGGLTGQEQPPQGGRAWRHHKEQLWADKPRTSSCVQTFPPCTFWSVLKHWCHKFKLMKVFLKITQARYWEALTSRSASSIPPLLLQLQCNKQPFQISNKQYSHYFHINSLSSLPPINTDSTVQTHLQLSCCCSAPFPRQDEGDKRDDNSFHFLNIAEGGIGKAASVTIPGEKRHK